MPIYRRLRYQVRRLRSLGGSPHSLALGCAVGMFMGIMPVMPLRSVLIFSVAIPARANLVAAFILGHLVANPFFLALWYSLALACGNLLVANAVTMDRVNGMLESVQQSVGFADSLAAVANIGWDIVVVLLAGGVLVALPVAVVTYLLALRYFLRRQAAAAPPPQEMLESQAGEVRDSPNSGDSLLNS